MHPENSRGFVHSGDDAGAARANGADDVVVGNLGDLESIRHALRGTSKVFYIAPAFLPNEADVGLGVVQACVEAGISRFVFSSVIHPVLSRLSNHAAKAPVEEALLDSGMEYTLLHPSLFFQNYLRSWPKVLETGTLAEPWSAETRFSRVDYRDVAEVAALALTSNKLLFGTFELCADTWLNRRDVAALMGDVLGREIKAVTIDRANMGKSAERMRAMFDHYDKTGLLGSSLTLRAILGREPRTLRAYLEELASNSKEN